MQLIVGACAVFNLAFQYPFKGNFSRLLAHDFGKENSFCMDSLVGKPRISQRFHERWFSASWLWTTEQLKSDSDEPEQRD